MIFKTPWIIFLIPFVLIPVIWVKRKQRQANLRFPSADLVSSLGKTWKTRLMPLPFYLRLLTLVLFILALAGPRRVMEETVHKSEGIDIVLAVDASGSMAAEDFVVQGNRTNRLEAVKGVVNDFIDARQHDRIGMIAFAGLAYTVSPLTTDYSWLKINLDRIALDLMEDGTAVGSAISSSLARLKKSTRTGTGKAKSKLIILLTDGVSNAGKVTPLAAAQAAQALDVKIYTIGAGTKGYAPYPVTDRLGRVRYQKVRIDLDERTLKEVARITDGKYFRATDTESLRDIYREIDVMEKTEIEESGYKEYKELFVFVLVAGLLTLLCELILSKTLLLRLP